MENTIRFPQTTDIIMNHYYIYKDIKAIESLYIDRDYTHLAVLCSQGVVHIYDNLTKLKLGKIEFLDILKESSLIGTFEASLKSLAEKDKLKIIDSVTFSKNPGLIGLSSSKLSALFLIKTNFTSLIAEESRPTIHDFYPLDKKNIVSKESPLGFIMDPCSEYCFIAFAQNAILSNFLKKTEFRIPLEVEFEISTQKKEAQEERVVAATYLDRYCTRSLKRIVCCFQDQVMIFEVQFGDPKQQAMLTEGNSEYTGAEEYYNLVKLTALSTGVPLKTNYLSLSHTNQYLALKYSKKAAKIFNLNIEEKSIKEHSDFDANEGRSYHDIFFTVYDNQDDVHEDWAVILEKNAHGYGLIFSQLASQEKKSYPRAILDSNLRLKRAVANLPWRNAILCITDNGTLAVLENKIQPSWINYAYKFTYTNENIEYVEKEDEFDVQEDDSRIKQSMLDRAIFDELPEGTIMKTHQRERFNLSELQVKKEEFISSEGDEESVEVKEEDGAIEPEEENELRAIVKERIDEEVQE